jgi:membrane-associated phospholipid phosphatase
MVIIDDGGEPGIAPETTSANDTTLESPRSAGDGTDELEEPSPVLTTADVEVARAARRARAEREAAAVERARLRATRWRPVRWIAVAGWAILLTTWIWTRGVPFDREGLILWMSGGMFAASIGRRAPWAVFVDWLPFVLVLIAYDFARGASQKLNATTQWTPQIDLDKWIFFDHEPTVWLQQHLEEKSVRWWDGGVSLVYTSFFLLPYVLAAILWVRSRGEFYRFAYRFVALSFLGLAGFVLFPAAPPWAAARCTAADVVSHPAYPTCIYGDPSYVNGGLLGHFVADHAGVAPYVERLSGRGFGMLHIPVASALLNKGQGTVDLVAAIPSLHAGVTLLVVMFLWRRMRIYWRIFGVAYVLAMAFSLVYSAEHYFVDVLIGWILAGLVMMVFGRFDRWRADLRPREGPGKGWLSRYAGLRKPAPSQMENLWPPIETTPSSA